ncbi:hypothetical protein JTB14_012798 [Gonioctena quinquepunctata]|nr:hypothetical protein JTB14_012798 [Gonioctena quinquepunctata]
MVELTNRVPPQNKKRSANFSISQTGQNNPSGKIISRNTEEIFEISQKENLENLLYKHITRGSKTQQGPIKDRAKGWRCSSCPKGGYTASDGEKTQHMLSLHFPGSNTATIHNQLYHPKQRLTGWLPGLNTKGGLGHWFYLQISGEDGFIPPSLEIFRSYPRTRQVIPPKPGKNS